MRDTGRRDGAGGRAAHVGRTGGMAVLALAGVSLLAGGCEVWDFARNPTISFRLPTQKYTVSTTDARWKAPPAAFSQKIDCNAAADCCVMPPPGAPPEAAIDCNAYALSCDANQCATSFPFELPFAVDLAKQVPSLGSMGGKVASEITLQSLDYKINNQIGMALPPMTLSVAPARVTAATGNAEARTLVTLPATAAGVMVMDTIQLTPEAKQAFRTFARDFQTPFNFIASTTMTLRSGTPPPEGKVDIEVTGTVTASF